MSPRPIRRGTAAAVATEAFSYWRLEDQTAVERALLLADYRALAEPGAGAPPRPADVPATAVWLGAIESYPVAVRELDWRGLIAGVGLRAPEAPGVRAVPSVTNTQSASSDFAISLTIPWTVSAAQYMAILGGTDRSGSGTTVSSITWNGLTLGLSSSVTGPGGQTGRMGTLVGTFNATGNIVLTLSALTAKPMLVAIALAGIDTTTPHDIPPLPVLGTSGDTTNLTNTPTDNLMILATLYQNAGLTNTPGTNTTLRVNADFTGIGMGVIGTEPGVGSAVPINYTHANTQWWGFVLAVQQAGGAAGGGPLVLDIARQGLVLA